MARRPKDFPGKYVDQDFLKDKALAKHKNTYDWKRPEVNTITIGNDHTEVSTPIIGNGHLQLESTRGRYKTLTIGNDHR